MKNIHVLPTDKPSRLFINEEILELDTECIISEDWWIKNQNIYITSDEEIKEGDWFHIPNQMIGYEHISNEWSADLKSVYAKKIILTTDQDLIKDGVQAIDDEFLEWFVKNPICEEVETFYSDKDLEGYWRGIEEYQIIIPKEEPKQETLEEVRKVERSDLYNKIHSIVKQIPREDVETDAMDASSCAYDIEQLFYKWQQERSYSEEDLRDAYLQGWITRERFEDLSPDIIYPDGLDYEEKQYYAFGLWFDKFKNK
jgi:hypothetical protein